MTSAGVFKDMLRNDTSVFLIFNFYFSVSAQVMNFKCYWWLIDFINPSSYGGNIKDLAALWKFTAASPYFFGHQI